MLNNFLVVLVSVFCFLSSGKTEISSQAKKESKNVIVYFSGSDWCTICHQFSGRVIKDEKVSEVIKSNYVYYVADFPQKKKLAKDIASTNEFFADKLNEEGTFPKFVICDDEFNFIANIPSDATAESALTILKKYIKE